MAADMPIDADVIVLGSSPTGLYAVRELAAAGLRVGLADVSAGCAFQSRHVRAGGASLLDGVDQIEAWLNRGASANARPVLLPTSDLFIEFVMARAQSLAAYAFAPGYRGSAARLLDKASFHALCQEHGMATPGVWNADGRDALLALADAIPYPCILKPVLIHHAREFLQGKKVLLARNRDEFVHHVEGMPEGLGGWLVQEIIPGPESDITLFGGYVDTAGVARQVFTGRKLRQYPPGFGSASLVSSTPCDETRDLTLGFLDAIGFRGVCGAEYKRDPRDGRLKIIEINPRPTLWFQATHDAGGRIVEAAVRDLQSATTLAEAPQRGDVAWRYGLKDLASAWFYRRHGADFVFPAPNVTGASRMRTRSWPVYSPGDAGPALAEPLGYLRKAWRRR
jgi:predicted ATP-grasp superfamily ATP-dependent carboligase